MTNPAPVTASELLLAPISPDIELCYQTFGDAEDEAIVLIMGLTAPLTWWDADFCRQLAGRGYYVVRFDNRDAGRSTTLSQRVSKPAILTAFAGRRTRAPYSISDMADDTVHLMDHLGLDVAHVVGVSMGGMIAQTIATEHSDRVRSLVSIMSTTGRRTVGWQHPKLLPAVLAKRKPGREGYADISVRAWRLQASPEHRLSDAEYRQRAYETWEHGVSASGVRRQMMAVLTQPDRTQALHSVRVPTTVIHGDADPLVHVSGGRATARAVPDAQLVVIEGMGHDLVRPHWDTIIDAIVRNAQRAS